MLTNILNLKWVGLLSLQDADLLAELGKNANGILEYGMGGSTLIFGQVNNKVVSAEPDKQWLEVTRKRAVAAGCERNIQFITLAQCYGCLDTLKYDFCFVDGQEDRLEFAKEAWKYLPEDGILAFHDTRDRRYYDKVVEFISENFQSIQNIEVNAVASDGNPSNITVIKKRNYIRRENWLQREGRELWTNGRDIKNPEKLWFYGGHKI